VGVGQDLCLCVAVGDAPAPCGPEARIGVATGLDGGCICVLAGRVDCEVGTVCVTPGTDDEQPCPDVPLGAVLRRGGVAVSGATGTDRAGRGGTLGVAALLPCLACPRDAEASRTVECVL